MRPGAIVIELAAALSLGGVFAPPVSAAELLLEQPSACAIESELPSRAERALGQPLATAAPVRCTVSIERAGDAFAAQLEISRPGAAAAGTRSFRAPTCQLLADTLALAVALAVGDGETAARGSPVAASAAPPVPASTAPSSSVSTTASSAVLARAPFESDAEASREPEAPRRAGLRAGAQASLVADAGTLPGFGLGAAIGISLGGDRIEARAIGTYLAPRDESIPSRATAGVELDLLAAGFALCAPTLVELSRLRGGVCLGAELGTLSARAHGLSVSSESEVLWSAGRLDVEWRWAVASRFDIELALGAVVPLHRQLFVIDEFEPGFVSSWSSQLAVYRSEAIAGRLGIGFRVELGPND